MPSQVEWIEPILTLPPRPRPAGTRMYETQNCGDHIVDLLHAFENESSNINK